MNKKKAKKGLSFGAILGLTLGGFVLVVIIAVVVVGAANKKGGKAATNKREVAHSATAATARPDEMSMRHIQRLEEEISHLRAKSEDASTSQGAKIKQLNQIVEMKDQQLIIQNKRIAEVQAKNDELQAQVEASNAARLNALNREIKIKKPDFSVKRYEVVSERPPLKRYGDNAIAVMGDRVFYDEQKGAQ